jgi:hypothetical protein
MRLSSLGVVSLYNGDGVVFSLVYRPRLKEQLSMDRRLYFKVDCYWLSHNCSMEHEPLSTLPETDRKYSRLQDLYDDRFKSFAKSDRNFAVRP